MALASLTACLISSACLSAKVLVHLLESHHNLLYSYQNYSQSSPTVMYSEGFLKLHLRPYFDILYHRNKLFRLKRTVYFHHNIQFRLAAVEGEEVVR